MELAMKLSGIRPTETCLVLYVLFTTMARAAIVKLPRNSATNVGGNGRFNCSSDGSPIQWAFTKDGDVFSPNVIAITDANCNVNSAYSSHFTTDMSIANQCNLFITGASLQFGGYYTCTSGSGIGAVTIGHAVLVVVETNTNITSNVTKEGIVEDDLIRFDMVVMYSGPLPSPPIQLPPLYPSLKWTLKSDSSNVSSISIETANTSSSYIIVPAAIPNVPYYVCTLFFKPHTALPPNCDTSTPSYTFAWITPETKTSYNERPNITETPSNVSGVCQTTVLECHPNAYPHPHDIHWVDDNLNEVINGSTIPGDFGGEYICSVTNLIKGAVHTTTATHNISSSAGQMPSCEPVGNPKVILSWGNHTEIHPATGKSSKTVLASNTEVNTGDNSSVATIEDVKEVNLTCEADGLPNPMYIWYDSCVQKYIYAQRITILMTGSYTCIANNSISGRDFSERITIQVNLPASQSQSACTTVDPEGNNANNCVLGISKGLCILVLVIVIVFGLNILLTFAFLIYYGCSKTGREKINNKFRWIEKALPCLNGNDCQCSWEMFFFIFCSVIGGIIFIPYVLIASHCCQNNTKKSQDTYSLDESQSTNENSHENGGQHHKTLNSAVGQNPAHSPPPAPYRSPSQGARYPPAQQNFHHSTSNNRRQGPPYPPNPEGVVYQDLRIDFSPGSRRPVELMDATNCGGEYADLHST